jgi:hypothetical protein
MISVAAGMCRGGTVLSAAEVWMPAFELSAADYIKIPLKG